MTGTNGDNSAVVPNEENADEPVRTRWRCGRFPHKRCYKTMRAAEWAASAMRRREADGHLVNIFECGTHLHVGHRSEDRPVIPRWPAPPPLTVPIEVPPAVLARLGLS